MASTQMNSRQNCTARTTHPRRRPAALAAAASLGALALLSGCYVDTQRFSGVIRPLEEPLPEGALRDFKRGPEEAFVIRHGDTVSVRMAESLSTIKLRNYDKRLRAPAGSWVFCGGTGKAEVLLPGTTVVTLSGQGTGVIGASESRREPEFFFLDVTHARVDFGEPGRVQLPGGALLEAQAGTFVLERIDVDVVRVANRTGSEGTVSYRDAQITLQPSKSVDLALLGIGTAPFERDPSARDVLTEGGRLTLRGDVDIVSSTEGALLRAGEGTQISGYGQIMRLDPGDEVLFEPLGSVDERREAATAPPAGR